jgi:hypothetical protein
MPSLGIKVDACPGRLNQASFYLKRDGLFYGQCSEICGTGHSQMPIVFLGGEFCLIYIFTLCFFEKIKNFMQVYLTVFFCFLI